MANRRAGGCLSIRLSLFCYFCMSNFAISGFIFVFARKSLLCVWLQRYFVLLLHSLSDAEALGWASEKRSLKEFHRLLCRRSRKSFNPRMFRRFMDCYSVSSMFSCKREVQESSNSFLHSTRWIRKKKKWDIQCRVWSWLRMNASYRLNTCKSWGSGYLAC